MPQHKKTILRELLDIDPASLTQDLAKKILGDLIELITYHNHQYYTLHRPTISDSEYDHLFNLLQHIEHTFPYLTQSNSPTKKVWSEIVAWFDKSSHEVPLLSLENSYSSQDILDRNTTIQNKLTSLHKISYLQNHELFDYILEPKLDWSSIEVIYKYGHYNKAITRWDGNIGENITSNVRMLRNLPHYLEWFSTIEHISLRWEVVMPKNAFERLNQIQTKNQDSLFANPRNAAAWTLRQLDSSIVYKRWLLLYIFEVLSIKNSNKTCDTISTWYEQLNRLENNWIPVYPWRTQVQTIEKVITMCEDKELFTRLQQENVEMDGLVIKINSLHLRSLLGTTQHHPRRAIAYKYPTKQVTTTILDIYFQIWRTWVITPVAILSPVTLWWVSVRRATLHNFDFIYKQDIRIWDTVRLQRSGEVIPYIVGPIKEIRTWEEHLVTIPEHCPYCHTPIKKNNDEVAIYCDNNFCRAQIIERLIHAVSKQCLDISGLWDSLVRLLVEHWYLTSLTDLFTLKNSQQSLKTLPKIWQKKVNQLLTSIQQSKHQPLWRRIHAFWIKFVGRKVSKDVANHFKARKELNNTISNNSVIEQLLTFLQHEEFLKWVHGLWEQTIYTLCKRASDSVNRVMLQRLKTEWVHRTSATYRSQDLTNQNNHTEHYLNNMTCVISGSITWYTRETIRTYIEQLWSRVSSSVTSKTDFLLVWTNPWPNKIDKATKLGIPIVELDSILKK